MSNTMIAVVLVMLALAFFLGYWTSVPPSFETWFAKHQKTCPECGKSPYREHGVPMCYVAVGRSVEAMEGDE
jgi:hypothetical protein